MKKTKMLVNGWPRIVKEDQSIEETLEWVKFWPEWTGASEKVPRNRDRQDWKV